MHGVKDSVYVWQMSFRCPQDTDGNKQGHLAVPVGQFLDLVPREQATRPLSEGGLGIVDIPDKVRSIGMRAIELFRATAASYDRLEIKLERVCRAKVRSWTQCCWNRWAGSRLEFKNGTKTNPQGFWECSAKALNYATDTGEPQDGRPKKWKVWALYRWLGRKKDWEIYKKSGSKKWKNGVKLLLNYERSQLSPEAKIKKLRQRFVDLPFFFHSGKTVSVYWDLLKS